jgi:Cu-Zn family superoxide dismutase
MHGFHIHEKGDCSAPDASSAGSHFNPGSKPHGGPSGGDRHGGDLGNLSADNYGTATVKLNVEGISVAQGAPNSIVGRALIVHADADDLKTQPTGNSGKRIACGVIAAK